MKRRLDLSTVQPSQSAAKDPAEYPEPVGLVAREFQAADNGVIYHALSHSRCPDCDGRSLTIAKVSRWVTSFRCNSCDAQFECNWAAICKGDVSAGVQVTRFVTCKLCEGKGWRMVRKPPYTSIDPTFLERQKCCDCGGTGRI